MILSYHAWGLIDRPASTTLEGLVGWTSGRTKSLLSLAIEPIHAGSPNATVMVDQKGRVDFRAEDGRSRIASLVA